MVKAYVLFLSALIVNGYLSKKRQKVVSAACVSKLYGYDRSLCRHMAHDSSGRRVTRVVTLFLLTPSMFPCYGKEFNPISLHL